jgi:hypothetical protein
MFNNRFNSSKNDPLIEAVKQAQAEGDLRRQAVAYVNEQFGVFSRNAVVREDLAAYDAAIEEAVKCMKEGKPNDGNLANNYPPYDKVTRGDVVAGALGKDQMGGKKKKMEEKKMWEGQEDSSSGLPPSAAATQAAKQTPTPASTPKKTSTSDLSSTFSSARGATGMQEAQLDELKKPTAKTAMKAYHRAYDSDVQSGEGERSNRLYKWKQKHLPGKSARNQKDTGKADLPDVSNTEFHKAGYPGHVTKGGKLTKSATKETKSDIKSRLGKHTAPHLPEEAMNEEKWIQAAIKKKGALHKDLGVSQKKKIPLKSLKAASDDPGKTGKRARLALTLRKLHERLESDSFKAAQGTGKSVNEVAMGMPPAITPPAIAGQRMPGIIKRSGTASGKFVNQTSVKANQPPKTGTALAPAGNRLPTATGGTKLPVPTGSNSVTAASAPKASAGSGFTYSRGPSTPGVNPPHPSEKIGGFGNFKPASSGGGLGALSKGIGSAVAKVARFAANPVVGGVAAAMDPTPANQGENEFARQAKYGQKAAAPKPAEPAAAKPAAPAKQSFSQAYRAARDAASAAKQDPNKAQFKWTNEKGKEGTYQAAATKKDYVPASKQFKTNVDTSASAPLPPARPKDLTPTSASSTTTAKTSPAANSDKIATQIAGGKLGSPESVATSVKSSKPAQATSDNMSPEKTAGASFTPAPDVKQSFGSSQDLAKDIANKTQEPKKAPVVRNMQESVQVGSNKYRIV